MATAVMTPAAPKEAAAPPAWQMPKIGVGSMVLWYKDGVRDKTPFPALVAKIGSNNNIDLIRYSFVSGSGSLITASRHVDDPNMKDHDRQNGGAWDLTDEAKEIRKLLGK